MRLWMKWALISWLLVGLLSGPAIAQAMPHLAHERPETGAMVAVMHHAAPCHPGSGSESAQLDRSGLMSMHVMEHPTKKTTEHGDAGRKALACAHLCMASGAAYLSVPETGLEHPRRSTQIFAFLDTDLSGRTLDPPMEPPRSVPL